MAHPDEIVTVVDENDNIIESKKFSKLTDSDHWRVVQIWVEDKNRNVLMAKRKMDKKVQPGVWEPGASGTVSHPSDYETSAIRELIEELGIVRTGLELEKVTFYKSTFGSRACALFRTVVDPDRERISIQVEEVDEVTWMSIDELIDDYSKNPSKYEIELGLLLDHYK